VREAKLAEEQACVARVEYERATKAGKLSTLVVGISNALVDLRMLPIEEIPQLLKIVHEVLVAAGLILEHL
jgi:hypothetical protein